MTKRLLSAVLCVCILLGTFAFGVHAADTVVTGTVHGIDENSKLYVRASASTSAEVLDKLVNGDLVTILDTKEAGGITWYKVTTQGGKTGYSSAQYIRINVDYQTDAEFEAYLTAQKFPESYKVELRKLWAQHPTWIFKAQHLSMTWKRATYEESKPMKNAITTPEAWMSMEEGAYNWTTKTYVPVDSGGWVSATKQVISYYMDPRNFLDETYIFQFEDLQYSETQTVNGVKAILPSRFDKYAEDLLKAAKNSKVSAYFLATRMTQEGSQIDGDFKGDDGVDYSGYYNFFNYGAYAGSQHGAYHGAVTNGAIYAKQAGWNTPYKCLLDSAEKIGSGYINKGQNTLYYQKFNVAGENLYNHQYMTNVQAPSSEGRIRASSASESEKAGDITFVIPVYKNMPDEAAPLPGKTGNNNNFLDKITVSGCTLSPTFDRYVKTYTGEIDDPTVTSVKISATKNFKDAKVTGTGTKTLKPGENVFNIVVTATSGHTRTYTVTIITPDDANPPDTPDQPTVPKPTIGSNAFTVGETVTGVQPATQVKDFISALKVKDGTAQLYTTDGKKKAEGTVATGDILRLYDKNNKLTVSHPVVIYGDVNGDGKVNSVDLRRAQRHILGVIKVQGYFLSAADANRDGKVNSVDLRRAQRYILGILKDIQP